MSRSVPLWVGATDDAPVPPRVRLRIFEREGGKCWITGRKIRPGEAWELDHRIALVNGGRHAEDNLFPALKDAHREKTKGDQALKSKLARIAAKHAGTYPKSKTPLRSRPFAKTRALGPDQ
jgi:5-methylcytosine-specific restriction endonuclease McrA